jgi:hypothetical protein
MQHILEKQFEDYAFLKEFLDGNNSALIMVGEPALTEVEVYLSVFRADYLLKGLIFVLAAAFLAVFLAFALNAVRGIKNDDR